MTDAEDGAAEPGATRDVLSLVALESYSLASGDAVHHSLDLPGGSIDRIDDDIVSGWCVLPTDPNTPAALTLWFGRFPLACRRTDLARDDIAGCFGSRAPCGFVFPLMDCLYDLPPDSLARVEALCRAAPLLPADFRVTVDGFAVELPRWSDVGLTFSNADFGKRVQASLQTPKIGWFDAEWYAFENTDAVESATAPFQHYCSFGCRENRAPNPYILRKLGGVGIQPYGSQAGLYLDNYNLVVASGIFDRSWYEDRYDIDKDKALTHYLTAGAFTGCDPNPAFDGLDYMRHHLDATRAGINPLVHYVRKFLRARPDRLPPAPAMRLTTSDWLRGTSKV